MPFEPAFLHGEDQDRRQPSGEAVEQVIEHRQRRLARHRGDRVAIERVLADVEIEGAELDIHEIAEQRDDAAVVIFLVGSPHLAIELGQPVQHELLELGHVAEIHGIVRAVMGQIADQPAHGVAQLAIGIHRGLDDVLAQAQIFRIVGGRDPEAQYIGAILLDDVLRGDGVAQRLAHLAAFAVHGEAVRQHTLVRSMAIGGAAFEERRMEPAAMLVRALQIERGREFEMRPFLLVA